MADHVTSLPSREERNKRNNITKKVIIHFPLPFSFIYFPFLLFPFLLHALTNFLFFLCLSFLIFTIEKGNFFSLTFSLFFFLIFRSFFFLLAFWPSHISTLRKQIPFPYFLSPFLHIFHVFTVFLKYQNFRKEIPFPFLSLFLSFPQHWDHSSTTFSTSENMGLGTCSLTFLSLFALIPTNWLNFSSNLFGIWVLKLARRAFSTDIFL